MLDHPQPAMPAASDSGGCQPKADLGVVTLAERVYPAQRQTLEIGCQGCRVTGSESTAASVRSSRYSLRMMSS